MAKNTPTCCGLAAPQIGVNKQIAVVYSKRLNNWFIIVNPRIVSASEKMSWGREGCLSHPGVTFEILRHDWIKLNYVEISKDGAKEVTINLADDAPHGHIQYPSLCRIVQHETQHCVGIPEDSKAHLITDLMNIGHAREAWIDLPGQETLTKAYVRNLTEGYADVQSDG